MWYDSFVLDLAWQVVSTKASWILMDTACESSCLRGVIKSLDLLTWRHVGRRVSNHDNHILNIFAGSCCQIPCAPQFAFLRHALCLGGYWVLGERSHDVGYSRGRIGASGYWFVTSHIVVELNPLNIRDLWVKEYWYRNSADGARAWLTIPMYNVRYYAGKCTVQSDKVHPNFALGFRRQHFFLYRPMQQIDPSCFPILSLLITNKNDERRGWNKKLSKRKGGVWSATPHVIHKCFPNWD